MNFRISRIFRNRSDINLLRPEKRDQEPVDQARSLFPIVFDKLRKNDGDPLVVFIPVIRSGVGTAGRKELRLQFQFPQDVPNPSDMKGSRDDAHPLFPDPLTDVGNVLPAVLRGGIQIDVLVSDPVLPQYPTHVFRLAESVPLLIRIG